MIKKLKVPKKTIRRKGCAYRGRKSLKLMKNPVHAASASPKISPECGIVLHKISDVVRWTE